MNYEQKTQALEYLAYQDEQIERKLQRRDQIIAVLAVFLMLSVF
jgi:hypothetical protein